jgi:TRAP-type C4-dicarboxylate transport system substrate-binding protein
MKRKIILLLPLVLVVAIFAVVRHNFTPVSSAQFPDASKDRRVTLRWGSTAATEDLVSEGMRKVAKLVEERSGGTLRINVFPASQLGDAMTQMEMVIAGNIDMFMEGSNYMADWGVPDRYIGSIYFQLPNEEAFLRMLKSDLYKSWEAEFLKKTGLRTLASNWVRPPVQFASNVPLYKFEDYKNLKIRSLPSEYTLASLRALGTNPTSVAYNEVYMALQQGLIDATIATLDAIYKMNFYQVAKYLCLVNCNFVNNAAWINEKKFKSLSPAQQEILLRTCQEVGEWYSQTVKSELQSYVDKMVEYGMVVINYTPEERAKFAAATKVLIDKYAKEGRWSPGLYERFIEAISE